MGEIKQTFTTSDGKTFPTIGDAEHHEKFIKAEAEFSKAWNNLRDLAIKSYKTADGYAFNEKAGNLWDTDLFLVADNFSFPSIVQISLYPSEIHSISARKDDIEIHANYYVGGNLRDSTIYLSQLYKKKENAKLKLIELLKNRLKHFENEIEALGK